MLKSQFSSINLQFEHLSILLTHYSEVERRPKTDDSLLSWFGVRAAGLVSGHGPWAGKTKTFNQDQTGSQDHQPNQRPWK
jgi:hypothetical protein